MIQLARIPQVPPAQITQHPVDMSNGLQRAVISARLLPWEAKLGIDRAHLLAVRARARVHLKPGSRSPCNVLGPMPVHVPVHERSEEICVVCSQQVGLPSQCVVCIGISGESTAYISVPSHAPIWTVARSVVGAAIHHLCEIRVDGHAVTFSSPAHHFRDRVVRCFLHGLPGGAGKNNQLKSRIVQLLLDSQIVKTVDLIYGKVPGNRSFKAQVPTPMSSSCVWLTSMV